MRKHGLHRAWILGVALAGLGASACGGDDDGGEPAAFDRCEGVTSGNACTWIGTTRINEDGVLVGREGYNGDGLLRWETDIYWSMDMLWASDGTPWFIDWNNHIVRRVLPDDTVESVLGWVDPIFPGDGNPSDPTLEKSEDGDEGLAVRMNHPTDLAEDDDGNILVMAWHNHKLRQIDPDDGSVKIIAGGGAGFAGDGLPMAMAQFRQPKSLVRAEDGTMYIGDQQNFRVRKIAPDGTTSTIAGNGVQAYTGDGGAALEASIFWEAGSNPEPSGGLALKDDMLYLADTMSNHIRVIDLEAGTIDLVAGTGDEGFDGDGGDAIDAEIAQPRDLEIGPDGNLYFADTNNSVIRMIDLDSGEISTVAGIPGELGYGEVDGLPALETVLRRPFGLEFDPDGNMYIMDTLNSRIVKVVQ